jgi:hypothetical protein
MEVLWDFVQAFLVALAPILATALVSLLIAFVKSKWAAFKLGNPDEAYIISQVVDIAIKAAEEAQLAGLITEKKQYALSVAQEWLTGKGIKIDISALEAAIEAAVWDEFNADKPAKEFRQPDGKLLGEVEAPVVNRHRSG